MPLKLNGSTSGYVIVDAPAVAGTNTLTLPAVTDTVTTNAATQTLSNKTLSSPTITGTATSTGDISTTGTVVMGSSFLRNRIINGAMVIDQRNAGASVTPASPAGTYGCDRWNFNMSAASKFTAQQVADAPSGFAYSNKLTSSSAYTVGAGEVFATMQPIEGFNFYDFAFGTASAKTVTVSFWVKSTLTGTFGGSLSNYAQTRFYPFSYVINSANTWEQKSITITGDTSGTWVGASNAGAAYLWFSIGAGSSVSQAAGSWTSSSGYSATGAVSVVGTNAATWQITGVQLEQGSVATPFERQLYGQELALCRRYCYTIFGNSSYETQFGIFTQQGTNTAYWIQVNPVLMRASPTVTFAGNFQWTQNGGQTSFTPSSGQPQAYSFIGIIGNTGALTVGSCGRVSIAAGGSGSMIVSAEL
jgi:hypothetical protein